MSSALKNPVKSQISDQAASIRKEVRAMLGKRRGGFLAAFVPEPSGLRFETQDEKEEIILLLRRHPITNLGWLITTAILLAIPLLVTKTDLLQFLPARFQFVFSVSWYLLTFTYFFEKFLGWFFNVNIITDERVIDVDFPSILYKHISETKIDQIQDVSFKVGGFTRSLFNFGDVVIQTAGTIPEFCFEDVPNPERVTKVINQMKLEEEQEKIEGRTR